MGGANISGDNLVVVVSYRTGMSSGMIIGDGLIGYSDWITKLELVMDNERRVGDRLEGGGGDRGEEVAAMEREQRNRKEGSWI